MLEIFRRKGAFCDNFESPSSTVIRNLSFDIEVSKRGRRALSNDRQISVIQKRGGRAVQTPRSLSTYIVILKKN